MCHTYDDAVEAWLAAMKDLDLASQELARALVRQRRAETQERHAQAVMNGLFAAAKEERQTG